MFQLDDVHAGRAAFDTNARIPARPADESIEAQTTIKPLPSFSYSSKAIYPRQWTKIFSPLSTHSWVFSSNTAFVRMAEVSEPAPGSVMHMAAKVGFSSMKRARNFACCSGEPAACTAAAPSPPPGVIEIHSHIAPCQHFNLRSQQLIANRRTFGFILDLPSSLSGFFGSARRRCPWTSWQNA